MVIIRNMDLWVMVGCLYGNHTQRKLLNILFFVLLYNVQSDCRLNYNILYIQTLNIKIQFLVDLYIHNTPHVLKITPWWDKLNNFRNKNMS